AAGNDVDVQEIDAASNNGVDDVRALREAAKYVPARDRYKIYIVDEVHMLSGAAFNALLKTLEEPPGHIKFLLATTDPQKLPATILSRVQRHNIQLVPLGKIVARLGEELASHARNLVLASLAGVKQDLPDHEIRAFAQQAAEHDPAQLARVFELLQLAEDEIAKASNPRHALEVALLRAVHLAPAGSLPALVARIEALGRDPPVARPAEPRKAPPGWGARVLVPDAAPLRAAPTPPPAADPEPEAEPAAERPLDLNARWRLLLDSVRAARKPGAA